MWCRTENPREEMRRERRGQLRVEGREGRRRRDQNIWRTHDKRTGRNLSKKI